MTRRGRKFLEDIRKALGNGSASEAEQILCHVLSTEEKKWTRADLYLDLNFECGAEEEKRAIFLATERSRGIPLQYLLGYQGFLNHIYQVNSSVLIPRPETEVLCQTLFDHFFKGESPALGLEVGLGSGILSIELLSRYSHLRMWASEISLEAQDLAKLNAQAILGEKKLAGRLMILTPTDSLDVLSCFPSALKADFLLSNPPYLLASDEIGSDVRNHEPSHALFAPDQDPLHFYREIAKLSPELLREGAPVFLEVPHERANEILGLFQELGYQCQLINDLTGRKRVLQAHFCTNLLSDPR